MKADWGWINFSNADRDRVSSIMFCLKEAGVIDELGVGRLRDAISDVLFPGFSTIQTRAKYFLFTPVIIKRCLQEVKSISLIENFVKTEAEYLKKMADAYNGSDQPGIYGITLKDAGELQRKPSSIYWYGQKLLGIIKNEAYNTGFTNYFNFISPNANRTLGHDEDLEDAGYTDNTGIFIDPAIVKDFNPASIDLTPAEAEYLRETMKTSLCSKHQSSLSLYLLSNPKRIKDLAKCKNFSDYNSEEMQNKIESKELRDNLILASCFSEISYGAHLLYNYLIQTKVNGELKNKYSDDFDKWLIEVQTHINRYHIDDHLNLIARNKLTETFWKYWVENVKKQNRTELEKIIHKRESITKKGKAKLNKSDLSPELHEKWIGMKKQEYRFSQAKQILLDIQKGIKENA